MASKQFREKLHEAVQQLKEDYYPNDGDAFCHWAMSTYFELDEDDAFAACDMGGPRDLGLDAYWHDEEQRRIIVAQAKYSRRRGKTGADPVIDLARGFKWLIRLAEGQKRKAREKLKAAALEIAACRKDDSEYPIELICFSSNEFSAEAEREAEAINEDLWEEEDGVVQLKLVGLDLLEEAYVEQSSRQDEPPSRIVLNLEKHFSFEPDDAPKAVVASVNVRELAEIQQKYHYRIFQRNVRYFLKAGNRVNRGIESTLSSAEGRAHFWYYNNGIAVVCDRIDLDDPDAPSTRAVIKNLQIVNGCQTTTTLGDMADELEAESSTPAYVLVRFIESDDPELQGEISRFNNRQNAVKDRDLMSNDDPQERLEREFADLDPPWFFERKRGQWDAESKSNAAKRRRFRDRRIDNEVAAQAAYAFWRDPGIARARKRMLFVRKTEDLNGLYDQIFTESTSPEWLLLPFKVQNFVAAQKRMYMRELKSALEASKPSVKEKRVLGRQWLKVADQMIVGAIRIYWEQHLDLSRATQRRELLDGDSFQPAVEAGYDLAVRDLSPFFRNKTAEGESREKPFDPANFVKGNWTQVREWIEDQLEYDDNWDAFSEIPAFEA